MKNWLEEGREVRAEHEAMKTATIITAHEQEWSNVAMLSMKAVFPKWKDIEGIIKENEYVRYETEIEVEETDEEEAYMVYEDTLFKCLKEHPKEDHLFPTEDTYLYVRIVPEGTIEEWEQRDYRNPYVIGDGVLWEDETYTYIGKGNEYAYDPTALPSAWKLKPEVGEVEEDTDIGEIKEWSQPGWDTAYELGAIVRWKDKVWESNTKGNTHEPGSPGVYTWDEVPEEEE